MKWRTIEEATTKRVEGCCVTSEKMLVKGLIDDEDYRIVEANTMVNRNLMCVPVRELNAPELRESEDEKARKGLINFLNQQEISNRITFEAKQFWLAWLEKQKDINCLACDQHLKGYLAGRKVTEEEKQKENPKTADSIPENCTSDAKCEDRSPKHSDSDGTDIRDTPAYWRGWDDAMKQKEQNLIMANSPQLKRAEARLERGG